MKTFKRHILEKLRITNGPDEPETTVTYLEIYNKINKYCRSYGCKSFIPSAADNQKRRPEFVFKDEFEIINIWPINGSNLKLTLRIINPDAGTYELKDIIVTGNEDKIVDFISPEWVDKIMKYLKAY